MSCTARCIVHWNSSHDTLTKGVGSFYFSFPMNQPVYFNHPSVTVPSLSPSWSLYTVTFSEEDTGERSSVDLDGGQHGAGGGCQGLEIQVDPRATLHLQERGVAFFLSTHSPLLGRHTHRITLLVV